jgi:predicted RNA-binding protein with RPS1 domain
MNGRSSCVLATGWSGNGTRRTGTSSGRSWSTNRQRSRAIPIVPGIVELGWRWLIHPPSSVRSGTVPHDNLAAWAYVWQDLLKQQRFKSDPARNDLLKLGVAWLEGRDDRSEWNYVWQRLLESPSLPPRITRDDLLALGVAWLEEREDRSEWNYVWQRLLESPSLPPGITRDDLLALGVAWLEGRDDRDEWNFVWQRLLESPSLPPGITRDQLLSRGVAWLEGRDDRDEWTFVWRRLIETRKEATAIQRDELLRFGREWLVLPTNRPRPEWDKLLENWIDAGGDDGELLRAAADWIMQHRDEKQVPPFAAKVLRAAREPAAFDYVAQWLVEWCRAHPDAGQSKFVIGFLRTEQGKGWTPASDTPSWKALLDWLAAQSPPIHRTDDASVALLQKMQVAGQRVFGRVTQRLPKGFLVELRQPEITAFLPGSQVDLHAPTDWDAFVGLECEFTIEVVSLEESGWSVVVSRRRVLEVERAARTEARLRELHAGDHVVGTVKRLVDYGSFIDLDGVDGLLHLNEMAWHRPTSPADYCVLGQQLELVVLSIDAPKRQVALGLKQLTPNPWEAIGPMLVVGSDIDGIVTNLVNFGAFIEVAPGVTGLLHVSNLSWAKRMRRPKDCLQIGQPLRCRILRVDVENEKLELGLKQLAANPREEPIPRQ